MNNTADFYCSDVVKHRHDVLMSIKKKNNSTDYFIGKAVSSILNKGNSRVLDLGTGNGYVLTRIAEKLLNHKKITADLIGIDLSPAMVEEAKKYCKSYKKIQIVLADNKNLPFKSEHFDIVTDKNSTSINLGEVYRVLKPGGGFLFKEYGLGKGLKEVTDLFSGRVIKKDPLDYLREIRELGFHEISFQQYWFGESHSFDGVRQILESTHIIEDYSPENDDKKLAHLFTQKSKVIIHSDPFIIYAKK